MKNNRLIELDNHQIQFELDGKVYLIPRKDVEEKLKVYWFIGDLYNTTIRAVKKESEWLTKYQISK